MGRGAVTGWDEGPAEDASVERFALCPAMLPTKGLRGQTQRVWSLHWGHVGVDSGPEHPWHILGGRQRPPDLSPLDLERWGSTHPGTVVPKCSGLCVLAGGVSPVLLPCKGPQKAHFLCTPGRGSVREKTSVFPSCVGRNPALPSCVSPESSSRLTQDTSLVSRQFSRVPASRVSCRVTQF